MTIGNQAAKQIHDKVAGAPVPAMFDLGDVLQLIDNRFNNKPPSQKELIPQGQQPILHVGPEAGDQLNAFGQQGLGGFGSEVAFIAEEFAEQGVGQPGERRSVVGIAGSQLKGQDLAQVV